MSFATEFRRLTEEANPGRDGRGRRYSKAARQAATRYCLEQRKAGRSLAKIAHDLGINAMTLGRWLKATDPSEQRIPFREVAVVERRHEPASSSIHITLANGLRIDGLSRGDVIELVKALA